MYKNIKHLSPHEARVFMRKYYSKEVILKQLFEQYGISYNPSIYKDFPPIILKQLSCPYCSKPMQYERQSKSAHLRGYSLEQAICPRCSHENVFYCSCLYCQEKERQAKQRLQEKIYTHFQEIKEQTKAVSFESLSASQKIRFGMIFKFFASECLSSIKINLLECKSSMQKIVQEMIDLKVLLIDPNSPSSHFNQDLYHLGDCYYLIPNLTDQENNTSEKVITKLLTPVFSDEDIMDIYEIWKTLCERQSLALLYSALSHYSLSFNAGEKTLALIREMILNMPLAHISYIFRIATDKAIARKANTWASKKEKANLAISISEQYYRRAISEEWKIYTKWISASNETNYFLNNILGVGSLGFILVPNLDFVRESILSKKKGD